MATQDFISLSQIGLYNPQRISDEVMEKLFIVRQNIFKFLMNKLKNEAPNSIPQHHLIIAQRGMGKTTLLKRIEIELRKNNDYQGFIPLLYPEEQHNLSNLAEFWLNSLDALADTLHVENQHEIVKEIDQKVKELMTLKNDEELSKQAYQYFQKVANDLKKRPVLLVDNLNLVFDGLAKAEQHTLRAILMQNNAPILLGASAISIENTYDYGAPFYDAFQMHHLQKLTFEELIEILKQLATLTNATKLLPTINEEIGRLKTIHQLTGGNPRTAVMLFKLIVRGFSKEINDDLEALLDDITPLYKAKFEELSPQNRKIVGVVALNWDPIHLELIRNETRLENGQLSPQLKRLVEVGWIERSDAFQAKGSAYSISERFFNIWFLMRYSSRRQKKELLCLSKFLESFYGDNLSMMAQSRLGLKSQSLNHVAYDLAMAEVVKDPKLKKQLQNKSYAELREYAKTNPEVLKQFDVPTQVAEPTIEYLREEESLLEQIKKNPKDAVLWNSLGDLYQDKLQKFKESESSYLRAIKVDKNFAIPWNRLGALYQVHFKNYDEAKKAYLKAAETDKNYSYPWHNLGGLYQMFFKNYTEAESAYLKAIEIDKTDADPWNNLGNLYQDHFQDYEKSENAYLKSIELDNQSIWPKYNLIFLYRDKLNRKHEAEDIFNTLSFDENLVDSYWLNKTLFALYDKNEGIATEYFEKALNYIEKELSPNTQDDWWRFGAIATKLGYGRWLLGILESKGYDKILSPYFVAIRGINEKNQEGYLNSKAIEVREPAKKIIEMMQKYLK